MKHYLKIATILLQVILLVLFSAWLILFIVNPVMISPDSYEYLADAKNLFVPSYVAARPLLFPAFLHLIGFLGLKMSIIAYLINIISLLFLVYYISYKRKLFAVRNTVVMIVFLLLTAIWSYCGNILTESILFGVEVWIFILYVKIIFPERQHTPRFTIFNTIFYALIISFLGITLKPWIMIMVLLCSGFLCIASWFFRSFRPVRPAILILFAINVLCFLFSLNYNRSKSHEAMNLVVLMVSSGNEGALRKRLAEDTKLSPDSAQFIQQLLADIELVNNKFKGNPWNASASNELKLLNFEDKKHDSSIYKGFRIMYLENFKDLAGLGFLALDRYVSQLEVGVSCLDIAYGPELPGLRSFAIKLILWACLLIGIYQFLRKGPDGKRGASRRNIGKWLKENEKLTVFTSVIIIAGILSCLFLCVAGADELQRTVLPPVLFQLFAIACIILKSKNVPAG